MSWWRALTRRSRREVVGSGLVLAGLVLFVVLVYVLVVLGGGQLIGRTDSPALGLSVLATAIVALAFETVQGRLEAAVSRALHGGTDSPYEVLSRFSGAVTGSYPAEELPSRMAKVLADGTGAAWAQVWLIVDDRPRLAATWPPDVRVAEAIDDALPGRRSHPVTQGGERLGVLVIQERDEVPLTGVEDRLFVGLAGQAGLVLRGARLRAELTTRADELSAQADELRESRQRLVDAQDTGRRRLERDIHDSAQQHLVALAVNLRLAQTLASTAPDRADAILVAQIGAAADAIDTLTSLARGIYPRVLTDDGLAAALHVAVAHHPVPVDLDVSDVERLDTDVEAALYFCCLEALQNSAKHSGADHVSVRLHRIDQAVVLRVEDEGVGFEPESISAGVGLANMRDRLAAAGGQLSIQSSPAGGTVVSASVPVRSAERVGG